MLLGRVTGVRLALAAGVFAASVTVRPAIATGGPPATFYGAGLNLGGVSDGRDSSALIGLEGSIVHLSREFVWTGGYVDALYDFQAAHGRFSLGPEFGFGPVGVDAGYVLAAGRGGFQHGFALRPMLTTGWLTLYYRRVQLTNAPRHFHEVGILLKAFDVFAPRQLPTTGKQEQQR